MLNQQVTAELEFSFSAVEIETDYGVPGSPTLHEIHDVEFQSLHWNEDIYDYEDLVERFGQHGADGIVQLGRDSLDEDSWND